MLSLGHRYGSSGEHHARRTSIEHLYRVLEKGDIGLCAAILSKIPNKRFVNSLGYKAIGVPHDSVLYNKGAFDASISAIIKAAVTGHKKDPFVATTIGRMAIYLMNRIQVKLAKDPTLAPVFIQFDDDMNKLAPRKAAATKPLDDGKKKAMNSSDSKQGAYKFSWH